MVGLFGVFRRCGGTVGENEKTLKRMLSSMSPNLDSVVNTFFDKNIAIGRIGLGVLNKDPQPVCDAEKRYFLFMDGQIYDYDDTKQQLQGMGVNFNTDTEEEVVLNLFQRYNTEAVKYLKGLFLIVIYDTKTNTLYIMNSRYGQEYLYYYLAPDAIIFASSIQAVLATGKVDKAVNIKAIYDFYKFGFVTGDDTFIKDIQLFPYASTLECSRNIFRFERYWDYPKCIEGNGRANKKVDDFIEEGSFLLERAIARHVKDNRNIGVPLSGGLDSRVISAYLSRLGEGLNVFHIKGLGDILETKNAKAICSALRGRWHSIDISTRDFEQSISHGLTISDGHLPCDQYRTIGSLEKAYLSEGVNYLLSGFAMDILFQPLFIKRSEKSEYSINEMVEIVLKTFSEEDDEFMRIFLPNKFCDDIFSSASKRISDIIEKFESKDIAGVTQYFHFANRSRRFIFNSPVVNRSSIEYGYPGLDYDLIDFGLSLPLEYRLHGELYRRIIACNFPDLCSIPWPVTGLPLDRYDLSTMNRKRQFRRYLYYASRISKGRFEYLPNSDLNRQLRKNPNTRKFFYGILRDDRTTSRGLIDKKGVERLIAHQDSGRNYGSAFILIATVELWYRQYID